MPHPARPTCLALCLALSLLPAAWAEDTPTSPPGPTTDTPAKAPDPQPAPALQRSQEDAVGLERQLPEKQQQTLQAGQDSFLALWQPANSSEAQGVVVIVPGDGENADWPVAVGPLRSKLPDAGWQTLSLTLPDPQDSQPQPRQAETSDKAAADSDAAATPNSKPEVKGSDQAVPTPESTGETGSGEPAQASAEAPPAPDPAIERRKAYADRVMARIQAGIDFALQGKPKRVVLLGHGTGGYWAARYIAEREPSEVRNLVVVSASLPRDFRPALDDMVPRLEVAVGDFYYKDSDAERRAAQLRLKASKREKGKTYVQVGMNSLPADRAVEQDQLFRRVRGWLSAHIEPLEQ
ncbi:MAG: hypothetical protein GAK45_01014 [Pseudomonas citronellolis]|nr:MAG: hypothetical protein GAK45_01014 [Pseudomonas citronellolis]